MRISCYLLWLPVWGWKCVIVIFRKCSESDLDREWVNTSVLQYGVLRHLKCFILAVAINVVSFAAQLIGWAVILILCCDCWCLGPTWFQAIGCHNTGLALWPTNNHCIRCVCGCVTCLYKNWPGTESAFIWSSANICINRVNVIQLVFTICYMISNDCISLLLASACYFASFCLVVFLFVTFSSKVSCIYSCCYSRSCRKLAI